MDKEKINVGGQAVIEGVLIRGPSNYVVAVLWHTMNIIFNTWLFAKIGPISIGNNLFDFSFLDPTINPPFFKFF